LIWFDPFYFDIILGINYLHAYGAKIDCKNLNVILTYEKGREVCFYEQREDKPCSIISTMKANKLLGQGCEGYWWCTMDIGEKEDILNNIMVQQQKKK